MVEATTLINDAHASGDDTTIAETVKQTIPLADYCLVGWDLDTTGQKLIDEIYHVAAFTPQKAFSQYVMPYGDINYAVQRRHMVEIVTTGMYRLIRDVTRRKILRTKSEISALTDFVEWLENLVKENGKAGVLLVCHEVFKFNSLLILQSMQKYNLMERFSQVVKGFVDCHGFAKKKCEQTMVSFSIRILSKVLLDKDNVRVQRANSRAQLAYEIVQHLCAGASEIGLGAASPNVETVRAVLPFTNSIEEEEHSLSELQSLLKRQQTLKPIFVQYLKNSRMPFAERRKGLVLRKFLVDSYVEYDALKEAWTQGKEEQLTELLRTKLTSEEVTDEHREKIVELVRRHMEEPPPSAERRTKSRRDRSSRRKNTSSSDKENVNTAPSAETKLDNGLQETKTNGFDGVTQAEN